MPVQSSGGGIKSIQRGTLTIPSSYSFANATIAAVDTTRSIVKFKGVKTPETLKANYQFFLARLWLTNATTIGAVRNTGAIWNDLVVAYEVVEFYP